MRYNLLFLALMLGACNNDTSKTADDNTDTIKDYDTGTSSPAETVSECYENIHGKDTVFLSIFSQSRIITGSLTYNYYEKDKNSGTIKGNMYGDTLIAAYVFNSEGTTSTREVAFLKQGATFTEGYGDMADENGVLKFKDRHKLNFSGRPMEKVACKNE